MTEIESAIIIEMMGRPPEHLKGVMKAFLEKLGSEKGVVITGKKVHKPKIVKQKDKEGKIMQFEKGKELYSTFAEVNIKLGNIIDLVKVVFAYMPSHVEILNPSDFKMPNFDLAAILNEITKKMHQYDAIAKNALMQNQMLANRLMQMQQILQNKDAEKREKKESKNMKRKKDS